ncbi:hypothetical protein BDF20DRAFT_916795 [Mycotypha africana]|uniref:uncharacterized protein n=1 Tax=Mycotypha africana TaxID=64632 RepID=UPI0022FFDA8A|nr:uncharacterized protein BDF20DRAFT_916795 [Mycotypha africana]KAI8968244.1 hypothetical protein BDF20DRAFT_916795 [Mycotypha africana]
MEYVSKKAFVVGVPAALIAITHLKSLPFAYTVRSWLLLKALIKRAKQHDLKPDPLFTVVSQDHRCYLDDIDYNQHMNNSMYNKVLDFSRIHILYTIFPKVMMEPDHHLFGHNGGVVTLFRREIPSLAKYKVQSRIWTWNEKWLFLQHRFVLVDDKNTVACLAVSKIVFKKLSGKTVPPADVLELCGHDITNNKYVEERRSRNWETAQHILSLDKLREDPYAWSNL